MSGGRLSKGRKGERIVLANVMRYRPLFSLLRRALVISGVDIQTSVLG